MAVAGILGVSKPPPLGLALLTPRRRHRSESAIRECTAYRYLGDRIGVCRVLGRYELFVDTADWGHAPCLILDGYWEMWVTEAIAAIVRPGMQCLDVGANLGYYTVLMADLCGPTGFVHAFEPNPPICRLLARSLAHNGFGWTGVHEVALGDAEGQPMILRRPQGEPKNAYLEPFDAALAPGDHMLSTQRLDADPEWSRAEFVKIDADASEERIWRGMAAMVAGTRLQAAIVEFAAARYADPAAFLGELTGHGFRLAVIDHRHGIVDVSAGHILAADPDRDLNLLLRR